MAVETRVPIALSLGYTLLRHMGANDGDEPRGLRVINVRKGAVGGPGPPYRDLGGALIGYFLAGVASFLVVGIIAVLPLATSVHVNIWWFESLGLGSVYGHIWSTQEFLFLLFGAISYVFFSAVFVGAWLSAFRPGADQAARALGSSITLLTGSLAALVAMLIGHVMAGEWQQYLLASHGQPFGIVDPVHHRDIGFYVFTIPWRETLGNFSLALLILGALELGGLAAMFTLTSPFQTAQGDMRRVVAIGSLFAATLFGFLAWRNFYLYPYFLNQSGTAYGGGATFVHASLWWYSVVGGVEIVTAVVLVINTVLRRVPLAWIALLPIVVGIASSAGQGIFQRFVVSPNELSAEYTYLGYTLNSTRHAYGIDKWKAREYTPHVLNGTDVRTDEATVRDARIADSGAFTQVMRGRQENRTYYGFNTADIDRYIVHGNVRQVLLAGRELDYTKLSAQAQTWVNQHIKFTHGYGLTMAPANSVTSDGQPNLWIENVPVQQTISGLPPVHQPRIYFGEDTGSWVLVGAGTPEFDSSKADRDTSYRYKGPDGVTVGTGLRRLALAWKEEGGFPFFDRLNISEYVTQSTRILLHRDIFNRVRTIAPWLKLDSNPYLVLRRNGSLVWMIDGITTTDQYPYSDPVGGVNYERNSVKVTLDAYTGKPTFYAFDASDPILRAWSATFPGLIHPLSQMPADLRAHIKYPDDFLNWQARSYQRYHVTGVTTYYNGDNEWDIESAQAYDWNSGGSFQATLQPIWTVARLFGERHDGFFSILPFSVRGKAPMAGYIAANNNTYQVTALDMPRGSQTTGARQFESLYQQAPTISSTLTLLDQHGSQVVYGQLLILPVGKALFYIRPLYLTSRNGQSLPQLIRVIVGTQNEVNWGTSLPSALNNLLTQGDISNLNGGTGTGPNPTPSPTAVPPVNTPGQYAHMSDTKLLALANQYFEAAQHTASLTQKDKDLRKLGQILTVLTARHAGSK